MLVLDLTLSFYCAQKIKARNDMVIIELKKR